MHQTLYRKYRPSDFSEVVGQKIIVKTLKNAIKNNVLSHAYLFTGPRGTGKTSIAKILAKTINCTDLNDFIPCGKCTSCEQIKENQSIDIIEIDAASNNGVDEIRELRSKVGLVPSTGKYKVYIIDEVHMLTTGAFNALLKTLEEPPAHIIFILATTEPHKIPLTILSRCQRFDFKKIPQEEMIIRLNEIINKEKVKIDEMALNEIIRLSDGGMRDALSILDQLLAYCDNEITLDDVHEVNGTITSLDMKNFVNNIFDKNMTSIFEMIDKFDNTGKNFIKITEEIILYMRNIVLKINVPEYFKGLKLDDSLYDVDVKYDELINCIEYLNKAILEMKDANEPRIVFELNLLKIMNNKKDNFQGNKSEKENTQNNMISREIIEKQNKIEVEKDKLKEKVETIPKIADEKINLLKKIRANNTLCYFNKKYYLELKNKLINISSYLLHPDYGEYASIIMDGELKAAGNNYLIFVYQNERIMDTFNEKIKNIEEMLESIFYEKYFPIAIDLNEWNTLKDEYNNKKRKFEYMEEPQIENEIKKNNNINEIEKDFNDIIEYS